ncbi:hypothetical protein C8R47DRAFT_582189 [Mycena vitilis]|nr:hypothetical protein C8R47DRAFT_582189 [Mycena vitilis]
MSLQLPSIIALAHQVNPGPSCLVPGGRVAGVSSSHSRFSWSPLCLPGNGPCAASQLSLAPYLDETSSLYASQRSCGCSHRWFAFSYPCSSPISATPPAKCECESATGTDHTTDLLHKGLQRNDPLSVALWTTREPGGAIVGRFVGLDGWRTRNYKRESLQSCI